MEPNPILYILMRTDLESMNPGKAMAQACHGANMARELIMQDGGAGLDNLWALWMDTRKFGTTIVLEAPLWVINAYKVNWPASVMNEDEIVAGVVTDPTYPLRDGSTTHLIELDTCAFCFLDTTNPKKNTFIPPYLKLHL